MTTEMSTSSLRASTASRRSCATTGASVNHWLTVSLRGTHSNRQGIGAIVSVVDEHGLTQSGICSTTSSYQSASDGRVHFGLADAKTVRSVEVHWPSGVVQVLKDLAANQVLEIIERSSNRQ